MELDDNYYINLAVDYLGNAIRDNTKKEKIIENGTFFEEEANGN
jgi:hypothetical protein